MSGSVCRDRADTEGRGGATITTFYGGIDLYSNNRVVVVIENSGTVVYRRRLVTDLPRIHEALGPYRKGVCGVVVESTYHWYWLVDGLMAVGYRVQLAHPTATQPYSGVTHTDDESDAEWLAEAPGILHGGHLSLGSPRRLCEPLKFDVARVPCGGLLTPDVTGESLVEWRRRTLGGDPSARAARSCYRVRRRPPAATAL